MAGWIGEDEHTIYSSLLGIAAFNSKHSPFAPIHAIHGERLTGVVEQWKVFNAWLYLCVSPILNNSLVLSSAMTLFLSFAYPPTLRRIGIQMISNNEISKRCTRQGLVTEKEMWKKFCVVPFIVQRVLFIENYSIIKWEMRKFRWKDELRRFLFFFRHHHQRGAILFYYPCCRPRRHTTEDGGRGRMWNLNRGGNDCANNCHPSEHINYTTIHPLTHFRVTTRILFSLFKQFSSGLEWGFIIQLFWWFFNSTLSVKLNTFLSISRSRMEVIDRGRETAIHRWGETLAGHAHEGASGLQVQAATKAQGDSPRGLSLSHAISFCARWGSTCRYVELVHHSYFLGGQQ